MRSMKERASWPSSLLLFVSLISSLSSTWTTADAIGRNQSLRDAVGDTLVSPNGVFQLGFFSPGSPNKRYLGIWFREQQPKTVVWVANRDTPLNDSTGALHVNDRGSLVLLAGSGDAAWSSWAASNNISNPVARLLDSGNLVVRDGDKDLPDGLLWQSFDEPGNTLLAGMKLSVNTRTGASRYMRSWKSADDPSPGEYTFRMDATKLPHLVLLQGSSVKYASGLWNGHGFTGIPYTQPNRMIRFIVVAKEDEVYYQYEMERNSTLSILVLNPSGVVQRLLWNADTLTWNNLISAPYDDCDRYASCGPYGLCNMSSFPVCRCLRGFEPKSPEWNVNDNPRGCVRRAKLDCGRGDGFLRLQHMKLPEVANATVSKNVSLDECRTKCAADCSCTAFASASSGGNACITWSGDLVDIRSLDANVQDLYLRVPASDLDPTNQVDNPGKKHNKGRAVAVAAAVSGTFLLGLCGCCIIWVKKKRRKKMETAIEVFSAETVNQHDAVIIRKDEELPLLDFEAIASATANFSDRNKIGEGGFGVVYKGVMEDGHEIAVKRLSTISVQGLSEFTNEVKLISKLRHRNLVRLLGCCVAGEERMLIYEYMQNKSLDAFIFDEKKRTSLGWSERLDIILGIARGLLYLHHDSGFRIIHRDLKAGNVLLDRAMNPKISDFGTARIFGADQMLDKTRKIIGTYGYMSPEYAIDGVISMKSDVFSFGVLVLEIVSGIRNRGLYQSEPNQNLLSHAWRLWQQGQCVELLRDIPTGSRPRGEALRCIQVGLLCVQEHAVDRPSMATVVMMLSSETFPLPEPKRPGFLVFRSPNSTSASSSSKRELCTSNAMTVTTLQGR